MNLQLFGYDDGFYYGQAKVIALATKPEDEGKTVTLSNGSKTFTGTMADGKCAFLVPGKERYTIRLGSYSTDIDISYGECIGVYMAEGYEPVRQKDIDALMAMFGGMRFGIDADGNYGYIKAGADSVTPFNTCYYVGEGTSFDIKTMFPNMWDKLTVDNFLTGYGTCTYSNGLLTISDNVVSGSVTATVPAGTGVTITESYRDPGSGQTMHIDRSGPLKNPIYAGGSYSRTITPKVWIVTHPL